MQNEINYLINHGIESFIILGCFISIIVFVVRRLEALLKWCKSKFDIAYAKKRGEEIEEETIGNIIKKLNVQSTKIKELEKRQDNNVQEFTKHEAGVLEKLDNLSNDIIKLSNLVFTLNEQNEKLNNKIDKQQEEIERNNEDNKRRDCAVLRDRLMGGMRYFSQNKDENGNVHIGITDHENLSHLFDEYFACNGNGTMKQRYENEFLKWIVDK